MEITWFGRNCFRLRGKEGVIITDPCPPSSGYKIGKQEADIVTVSRRDDPGYDHRQIATGAKLFLDAPGEYEIGGALVRGVSVKDGDQRNLIFISELDGVRVGHLGLLKETPASGVMDQLENIDILLVPVGGHNALGATEAQDLMTSIAPSIAIPMNYATDRETLELDPVDRFLSETGVKPEPEAKLTVTRSGLPDELTLHLLTPKV